MALRRWTLFAILLLASVAISVLGTLYFDAPFLALALVFPFAPFFWPQRSPPATVQRCPACGFETHDPRDSYCPRDGSRLA